ncbi:MAG: pyridoxal-phosphate dependent enzyme [Patescibacteria group bacterium]|nr:pyridoxal-phosphate dependent enzyme [Patescibacteria group bacterium]
MPHERKEAIAAPPVYEDKVLAKELGLSELFIWDGSKLPTGTWKDYRSAAILERIEGDPPDKVALVTAGNGGYSLGTMLNKTGIEVVSIIDEHDSEKVKKKLKKVSTVKETNLSQYLSSEEIIALARENPEERIIDVTAGEADGFEKIIDDIEHLYTGVPMMVVCPVGQGEGWVGLCRAIEKKDIDIAVIGIRPFEHDGPSAAAALTAYHPLVLRDEINERIEKGQGIILEAHEGTIWRAYHRTRNHVDVEPSSAIVFSAADWIRGEGLEKRRVVFINSGKGITA